MSEHLCFEDLEVGMSASTGKTITETDIEKFAEVSTDTNPVHMSEEAAAATPFHHRIAHGMLSAVAVTVSPMRTGARNRRLCPR